MTSIKMTDIDPALALKILNVKLGSILKIAEEIRRLPVEKRRVYAILLFVLLYLKGKVRLWTSTF